MYFICMYVQDTIARARIAEAFMNASATAGLSDNLEHLAKLVDEDDEDEGMHGCLNWYLRRILHALAIVKSTRACLWTICQLQC